MILFCFKTMRTTVESEERICGRTHFLLHIEMIIQGHFLEACHQTLVSVNYTEEIRLIMKNKASIQLYSGTILNVSVTLCKTFSSFARKEKTSVEIALYEIRINFKTKLKDNHHHLRRLNQGFRCYFNIQSLYHTSSDWPPQRGKMKNRECKYTYAFQSGIRTRAISLLAFQKNKIIQEPNS